MRILIVAPMAPRADGGGGAIPLILDAQIAALRERHEVTLVSAVGAEPGEEEAIARLAGSDLDLHCADRTQPRSTRRRWRRRQRLATAWLRGAPWRAVWFADPGVQSILDRLAEMREFDVAVVEDSAMSSYRLPAEAATVLSEHEVLRPRPVDWRPGRPRQWPRWAFGELDWRRRPRFQRAAWRRFDRVLAFSRRDAEAIRELAPEVAERVRVSPFGLVLPPVADPAREREGTLLFTGNFTHQPNRDAATWLAGEILPALRELRPGTRLRLLGSTPPPSVLALAGPGIEVIADPPSVEPYLEEAAVVVAPVRTGGGMRMKVLQALAAGKAVVTTPRGSEGFDCFEDPPPLALATDAGELAATTAALLGDAAARHDLGRRAREFAERHHSPRAWGARLEAVYEEARREREGRGGG